MATQAGYLGAVFTTQQKALLQNAAADVVTIADPADGHLDFAAGVGFAIECWVKIAAAGSDSLVTKGTGWQLFYTVNNAALRISDGVFSPNIVGGTNIADGLWHHLVGVRHITDDKLYIYVDGASDAVGVADTTTATLATATDVVVGPADAGSAISIAGVRIWAGVDCSAANAVTLHHGGIPTGWIANSYLRGWWELNEGTGAVAVDTSEYATNGVITNPDWSATTFDSVAGGACALVGGLVYQMSDVATHQVAGDDAVIYDAGVAVDKSRYTYSPTGKITFLSAPGGAITADYTRWSIIRERAGFSEWQIDWSCAELDTTAFINTGVKTFKPGLTEWTGSAKRHWVDLGNAAMLGGKMVVRFFVDRGSIPNLKCYEGWCYTKGIKPSASVGELINEDIEFRGSGLVAIQY